MIVEYSGRKLRRNHSSDYPTRMLFLDTETRQTKRGQYTVHSFLMAWTRFVLVSGGEKIEQDNWKFWTKPDKLCDYIESRVTDKKTLYIFGHNIYFDLQVTLFFDVLPRRGWKLDFIYDSGLTYILVIHRDKARIKVVSTTNYFDTSLKALGDTVGLPKLDVEFGRTSFSDLKAYCRRDVEITCKALFQYMAFNREHDTGAFRLTRASQSFGAYRHRFMDRPIWIHDYEPIVALERSAYFGGRTECFHIGEVSGGPFVFLDVNSMYPYVMAKYRYPSRILMWFENPEITELLPWIDSTCIVAEVILDTDQPLYAVRYGGKVVFPIGRFRTSVCTLGFRTALENGHILKVLSAALYEPSRLFTDYVSYFYPLKAGYKQSGNAIYERMVKLYLNSLYGKFGERRYDETRVEEDWPPEPYRIEHIDLDTGQRGIETHLFGVTIYQSGLVEGPNSFVAVSAHVTEYARFELYSFIQKAGRRHVFYCDTDSIAIRESSVRLFSAHMDPSVLGKLSVDKRADSLTLFGPKDYAINGKRKTKGIPKTATEIAENTYRYDQFLGSVSHLRLGETKAFLTRETTKVLRPDYDKGTVEIDGHVVPLVLNES